MEIFPTSKTDHFPLCIWLLPDKKSRFSLRPRSCWAKIPSAYYASGSCQTSESPLPRRGRVYPPASKESAQLSRRFSPAGFFVCGTGASLKKALVGASTQCTAKPAQTGGLTPPLPTLEKTELLCTAGKFVLHCGYFSFSYRLPPGEKILFVITHPASVKRRNPLSLVGAGSTRPLLRNLHNHPGGFPPPDFLFVVLVPLS